MDNTSWYLESAFEHDEAKSVVKVAQTTFVGLLFDHFNTQFETETLAFVEYYIGQKRLEKKEGDRT